MDADERLTALKKAYADIILNTAKEAAARIMSSEKKVAHYQYELQATKEEALRMLLRIKQLRDSKIKEAELTSFNQQKKIEELEAQLQEAEDIVRDLREELREVQAELGSVKYHNMKHINESDNARPVEASEENKIYHYQSSLFQTPKSQNVSAVVSDVRMPVLRQISQAKKCCNKIVCMCNLYNGNPDLPSIILRSKEPGLYKHGFTQRIRACGRNLIDKDLTLSGKSNKMSDDKVHKEYEEAKDICTALAQGAEITSCLEKELFADIKLRSFKSSLQKKKRAVRQRKCTTPSCKNHPGHFGKSDQAPELCVRTDRNSVKYSAHSTENPLQMNQTLSSERKLDLAESDGAHNTTYKDEELMENIIPIRQETGTTESTLFPDRKIDNEKVDMSLTKLECRSSNTVNGVFTQSTGERIIKYTFQRKRKRQPLNVSEVNVSLETNTLEKETGNERNDPLELELQKSSLITESSQESRRLVQVASQLLSLSDKKWQ
ncbi:Hypothetical predicted protein [Olea europaea subsp. europaea]|uniref:Uncharacterized protein n=3 Tax=Olea europaea subsp. europaea TaxID=158383 RepID=A0A8S0Q3F9_OLEEU|nr:Hypothetical predicted protein [Olea europaea subsp. europaea]